MRSADVVSGQFLVRLNTRLKLKRAPVTKTTRKKFDTHKLQNSDIRRRCSTLLKNRFQELEVEEIAKIEHITPAPIDRHWLPVTFRVQFKLLLIVYKSLHNQCPPYIKDLLFLKRSNHLVIIPFARLHNLLYVPKVSCSTLADRAFAHAAPVLWNSLPLTIRTSSSLAIFKKQLRTFLFKKAFNL